MKRTAILIITLIILSCSMFSAYSAETVNFSLESAEVDLNRIATIGVSCSNSADLGAAVFEFDYDKSALEFRGCESESLVRSNFSGDKLKVVFYNQQNSSGLFNLKFKAVEDGGSGVNFKISDCFSKSGGSLPVSSCSSGVVNTAEKASNVNNSLKSSSPLSGKADAVKGKSSAADDNGDLPGGDDTDDKALIDLGELNDNPERSYFPYVIAGCGVLGLIVILTFTVIIIIKSVKKQKKKNAKPD
ncbi:MAG: hypothetical protein Q3975_00500 [Oscillospiraceae bacterium]|nr:hypothetical protein [Oscillospiraceae bacterium]